MSDRKMITAAAVEIGGKIYFEEPEVRKLVNQALATNAEKNEQIAAQDARIRELEGLYRDALHEIGKLLDGERISDTEMMALLKRVNREFELEITQLRNERASAEQRLEKAIPIADIEAEIAHIQQNGERVKALPGMIDEGRCRVLCAMYLQEFITNWRAKQKLDVAIDKATRNAEVHHP